MKSFTQVRQVIQHMIQIENEQLDHLLKECFVRSCKRKELINKPYQAAHEVYFINKGILRVFMIDRSGYEHTTHFALENQFIADYASFLQASTSIQHLQALEPTEVVVMPRSAIEWGYQHLPEGDKLGRMIAEYYFIYLDNRIKNQYTLSPRERYDNITMVFPDIHNRAPQHMIASYLGISPVHLSRLKKKV
jgi:signal-transduction protein with cAMP-binding, CBS, and nucleotidyltransferase domain